MLENYSLLEYDAVSIDEGLGEAYVSTHIESRQFPMDEERSKSTYSSTPKDITSTTLHQVKFLRLMLISQ